jgi:dTDP-D-glucose 4,6-dehydratase
VDILEADGNREIVNMDLHPNLKIKTGFFHLFHYLYWIMSKYNITSALVVGGCGNLGHNVVTQLLKLDPTPKVFVFDLNTTNNRVSGVEYHDVDITNKSHVDAALDKTRPQVIFHTASPPPALNDLPLYLKVNVEGTRTLLVSAKVSLLLLHMTPNRDEEIK